MSYPNPNYTIMGSGSVTRKQNQSSHWKWNAVLPPLLLVLWIAFIFGRSLQPANLSDSESRWVLDLLQTFFPFPLTMHIVRKAAHFTEFTILGILAGAFMGQHCRKVWQILAFSLTTGLVIALCDETIQLFVTGRTGQIQDVWLDFSGAVAGTLAATLVHQVRRRARRRRGQ